MAPTAVSPRLTEVSPHRIGIKWAAIIFVAALACRALCFLDAGAWPLFRYPVVDAALHDVWAQRIVAGDWLGQGPDDVAKPPLYPYFLAAIYAACGRQVAVVQCVQLGLGAISAVLMAMLGARLLGRVAGRIAGLMAAFYAPMVFFELQLLTPSLSIILNLAATLALLKTTQEDADDAVPGQAARARSSLPCIAAGLLFGLSAGVRPDVLLPAFLVTIYVFWQARHIPWRRLAAKLALFAAGLIVAIAPVALRNYHITGRFILVSSNAGMNFYIGNSAASDGISSVPVGLRWERMVARMPQKVLEDPPAASRWWSGAAWQEIKAAPGRAIGGLAKKAAAFFNGREFRNNICYHFFQQNSPPVRYDLLQWTVVFPLAAWGFVRLWRSGIGEQRRAFFICILWIAGYWLAAVAYFVSARYRVPAVPFLILPAAWGGLEIARAIGRRDYRSLLACTAVVLAAGVLCWPCWFGRPQDAWTLDYVNLGNSLREAGDLRGAEDAYCRALKCDSGNPDAHYLLGRCLADRDLPAALQQLQAAERILPNSPDVLLALGQIHSAMRDRPAAVRCLNGLLREAEHSNLMPRRQSWALAHILLAEFEPDKSPSHWRQAWSIDPQTAAESCLMQRRELPRVSETFRETAAKRRWDWYAQANYGMILMEMNRPADASAAFRAAYRLSPQRPVLGLHWAMALHRAGKTGEALKVLNQLDKEAPESFRQEIDALRRRIAPHY
jgi:tetratricopeptide (TPR) repeat protein